MFMQAWAVAVSGRSPPPGHEPGSLLLAECAWLSLGSANWVQDGEQPLLSGPDFPDGCSRAEMPYSQKKGFSLGKTKISSAEMKTPTRQSWFFQHGVLTPGLRGTRAWHLTPARKELSLRTQRIPIIKCVSHGVGAGGANILLDACSQSRHGPPLGLSEQELKRRRESGQDPVRTGPGSSFLPPAKSHDTRQPAGLLDQPVLSRELHSGQSKRLNGSTQVVRLDKGPVEEHGDIQAGASLWGSPQWWFVKNEEQSYPWTKETPAGAENSTTRDCWGHQGVLAHLSHVAQLRSLTVSRGSFLFGALSQPQPWWKIQLFVWEPVLFGTWDGVFTSCMINIFGVVLFLRTGWLVGNTGVLMGVFLVSFVVLVALITVLSGIGVGERGGMGSGGVYSMISSVLGGQTGGTIGLLYVFGQCVAGAMYITGFAESISDLLGLRNIWTVRGISVVVLLALLGINLAGVKWIIRLQLLLLFLLAVSTLDFVVGSFTHLDPEHGFIGYSPELLQNNTLPDYSPGESFFTVFGVFFPAATGVMAGFNMGGDLREPAASIPLGSLAAVGISWFLYVVFVFLLGAICTREALRYNFLIAEKVSLVGFLFLLGLYISSLASCMGGLYGAPRILQCIAQEKVIPALACLGQGKGPSKTPVAAICLTSFVTMAFVLVGQVNVLAPIVTINFMLTYVAVDYSYFSLSMDPCSTPQMPEPELREDLEGFHRPEHLPSEKAPSYGSDGPAQSVSEGTLLEFTKDMDQLLQLTRMLESSQPRQGEGNRIPGSQKRKSKKQTKKCMQDCHSFPRISLIYFSDFFPKFRLQEQDVQRRPTSFYTHMCNPWVSLLGAVASLLIMFVIQWVYTLANMGVAAIVYFYIGRASPGLHLGSASNFSFFRWMRSFLVPSCRNLQSPQEQIILAPSLARVDMEMTQLTQENADFATRDRYHHSSLVSREQLRPQY
ncbi:solute carrier family 12 member 8 [Carlito syrichta]|uniref:Solute carrier family 12 member 8 n=1 Tax=Carlito syrichta TaxID=1868482 RepID=A0A3Q0DI00_CARSF|nr:solute carrier family 12 member 8 [Carlito syrichta]